MASVDDIVSQVLHRLSPTPTWPHPPIPVMLSRTDSTFMKTCHVCVCDCSFLATFFTRALRFTGRGRICRLPRQRMTSVPRPRNQNQLQKKNRTELFLNCLFLPLLQVQILPLWYKTFDQTVGSSIPRSSPPPKEKKRFSLCSLQLMHVLRWIEQWRSDRSFPPASVLRNPVGGGEEKSIFVWFWTYLQNVVFASSPSPVHCLAF